MVDQAGHLVGIVSQADVLTVFSRPDEEIRREVTERVIRPASRIEPQRIHVTVQNGIVTLSGQPETAQGGQDVIEAVRHVDGVVAVRDQFGPVGRLHPATS